MLLVEPPDATTLEGVIRSILDGQITREAVLTWQQAVFAECGWDIPIRKTDGFWYFYSLMFVTTPFPDGYFLRDSDLEEYLKDMNKLPGQSIADEMLHLRTWQVDPDAVRWPLTTFIDHDDIMARLPSSRGTFETRGDMVEHCHLQWRGQQYLLVKQYDEQLGQIMLLGSSRKAEVEALLKSLGAQ